MAEFYPPHGHLRPAARQRRLEIDKRAEDVTASFPVAALGPPTTPPGHAMVQATVKMSRVCKPLHFGCGGGNLQLLGSLMCVGRTQLMF